jgi:hypothetical protein
MNPALLALLLAASPGVPPPGRVTVTVTTSSGATETLRGEIGFCAPADAAQINTRTKGKRSNGGVWEVDVSFTPRVMPAPMLGVRLDQEHYWSWYALPGRAPSFVLGTGRAGVLSTSRRRGGPRQRRRRPSLFSSSAASLNAKLWRDEG